MAAGADVQVRPCHSVDEDCVAEELRHDGWRALAEMIVKRLRHEVADRFIGARQGVVPIGRIIELAVLGESAILNGHADVIRAAR